ncbi:MAG: SUF system NifU family Fe-S cluster assembly protein [Zetaproteobacteria bacterium]|nr:MAG: SUF system NifU family Fe-S cluster assembly protein [Zetaproteobacteria bacterium]
MFDLKDLYQQVIVDHNKHPRNFGRLEDPSHEAEGYNPLCGDRLHVYLKVDDQDRIEDVRFEGEGCAISMASASLMTEALKGRTLEEFRALFEGFHELVTSSGDVACDETDLGKLAVLGGVRAFPSRIKCATLCWHTMKNAIERSGVARTE